jgi:hypothetical protein
MHKFLVYFMYLFISALHVSGLLLAHVQNQAYNFRQWFKSPGYDVSAPVRIELV